MKRQPILDFFDISSNVEELPKNELFTLKGGYSDAFDGGEIDDVEVWGDGGDDPWGGDDGGGDDDPWDYDDNDYDEDWWEDGDGGSGSEGNAGGGDSSGGENNNSNSDPIQQLLDKVKFDADVTEQFKENFKAALESIKGTDIGETLLSKLAAKTGEITVTENGEHNVQNNTLNVGMFNSSPEDFIGQYQTLSLGHELFHLLQNAEYGPTKAEVSYEVEARLFEYELAKELNDLDNFLRNFATDIYKDNFIDFVEGNSHTIDDFNNLIDGFKDGTNGGNAYDSYDKTPINSLDDII